MVRYLAAVAVILAAAVSCQARADQGLQFDTFSRGQREVAILVGYGENHRWPEANKEIFSFDVVRARYGYFLSPKSEGAIDVSYQRANTSRENFTVSGTVSYRRYFVVNESSAIGADFSFGIAQLDKPTSSLGTSTNFTEQLGLCYHHTIGPTSAVTIQYTFSHTSNAGIKLPNIGVNASLIAVGLSYYPRR